MAQSELERTLAAHIAWSGLPEPQREFMFHPSRLWRFDFCWPRYQVAVEVEGGIWSRGRHTRGSGFENDCQKYNSATLLGWRVLRFTRSMIESGEALRLIEEALDETG